MSAVPIEDDGPREDGHGLRVMTSRRVAIILFNLGGPDKQDAVRPFLFNLFNDKAIIGVPQPFRYFIAQLISRRREKLAKANYALMGGGSPILTETRKQAEALETEMAKRVSNVTFRCFIAMRYWKPFIVEAAEAAIDWHATDAILLPLYPQFSTTTTASALEAWTSICDLPVSTICCYPAGQKLAQSHADAILNAWREGGSPERPRVLFSAHGLPQSIVDRGDPYQWQVEQSVAAVRKLLPAEWDTRICYQSRVGPMKWLAPSTEHEIKVAAKNKAGVIVAPIAFVSEHVETLVELDIEYRALAKRLQLPFYLRAQTPSAAPRFIDALADLTERALSAPGKLQSESGGRLCPAAFGLCAQGSGT
ncbi:Ferrochelatase [Terricaulis silvestris]|uniref:Ferrochelatase n=2 Tax=Terricaulis silvestris TaxID=2686094 RepID=A0A6I6MQW6_9CAUL|nr:ferrochelatase [Terricaulis silvestris]QGZ97019.1 Ferrochelatase [Terricaulis silvestris]